MHACYIIYTVGIIGQAASISTGSSLLEPTAAAANVNRVIRGNGGGSAQQLNVNKSNATTASTATTTTQQVKEQALAVCKC
jgi:hypothetical protein